MKIRLFIIVLLIVFSIPSVISLFHQGFFQSDDGEWMVIRFSSFYQSFVDGQFPVRFLGRLNHEYGYPVTNFLYPGFMYLGVPIHILGFGFVDAIKIIFGASMIGSAIFCYLWLSRFFDRLSSLVGALFYLYTPYHLFDLYKRGSIGEVLALAIMPFILWQIERKSFFWSSMGIGFLIVSHNTLALLFLPILFIYAILRYRLSALLKIYWYIGIFVVGLGLSAFFWLPAFFELQYTVFSQTQVSSVNSYFASIDLIGFSTIFVLFLTALFIITSIIKIQKHRLTALLLVIGLISVFFATSPSAPLWNILPVSFIQFPFRFLSLTIVCVAFLAAAVINALNHRHSGERSDSRIPNGHKRFWASQNDSLKRLVLGTILIVLLAVSSFKYLRPSEFFDKGEGFYSTNMDTTTVKNEYMPKWIKQKPVGRFKEKVEVAEGVGSVNNLVYNSKKITFDVFAEENTKVRVNTVYYPGWNGLVYPSSCHPEASAEGSREILRNASNDNDCEGKELAIDYQNEKGVMELEVPKGENKIELNFSETPLRLFADLLSIISILFLVSYGSISRKGQGHIKVKVSS